MTDTPKKRPWFQYHLSTLIVLQFVAAGLLWANMRVYDGCDPTGYWSYVDECGWPVVYKHSTMGLHGITVVGGYFSIGYLVIDAAIAFAIIVGVAVLLEWRIRRSDARRRSQLRNQ